MILSRPFRSVNDRSSSEDIKGISGGLSLVTEIRIGMSEAIQNISWELQIDFLLTSYNLATLPYRLNSSPPEHPCRAVAASSLPVHIPAFGQNCPRVPWATGKMEELSPLTGRPKWLVSDISC